jgi:hypothetical protein
MKPFMIIACMFLASCGNNIRPETLRATQDSLAISRVQVDSLRREVNRGTVRMKNVKGFCLYYAKIVQKNPKQSQFIVGWINDTFDQLK